MSFDDHNSQYEPKEPDQDIVEKGQKIITAICVIGTICNLAIAVLLENMTPLPMNLLFFFLLYRGYGWVRYYFIIVSAMSSIAILLIIISYYSILYAVPINYLAASTLYFIEGIWQAVILSVSKGVKVYMRHKKNERRKLKQKVTIL